MSVIWAVPDATPVTFPTRPSPVTTGWSTWSPSVRPLSICTVEYQSVGDRAITRAVTGLVPCGNPGLRDRPTIARSCSLSRTAVWSAASWARASASWRFSFLFSPFAPKASPMKLKRSRKGLAAVLAPFSTGDSTVCAPR